MKQSILESIILPNVGYWKGKEIVDIKMLQITKEMLTIYPVLGGLPPNWWRNSFTGDLPPNWWTNSFRIKIEIYL